MIDKLPDLIIGDLKINPPIIQGAMGARISTAPLVSAVCNEGAFGVIAAVGLGEEIKDSKQKKLDYKKRSKLALKEQIEKTREKTVNPFGVNIMYALSNYDDLVDVCVRNKVAAIISGAGLPLRLPALTKRAKIKLIPIVSSARAANIICRAWHKKYNRIPDAIIVEGPLAGGHLGFNFDELERIEDFNLDKLFYEVLETVKEYGDIPVIAAGGIFDGKDVARFLKLGASGVQMATRFVCTYECDVSPKLKEAFLKSRKEDIIIIKSPVGLPGRVLRNKFVDRILKGEKIAFDCTYQCLKTCDPETSPYCIAKALVNAYRGNFDDGFAMCSANTYRVKEMLSVKELIGRIAEEALTELRK